MNTPIAARKNNTNCARARRLLGRSSLFLILTLCLGGCSAATQAYKAGVKLQATGDLYGSAQRYLAALDHDAEHEDAQKALRSVARRAYDTKLLIAERYAARKRYDTAISEYRELGTFVSRLRRHSALAFAAIDSRAKIAALKSSGAEDRYQDGEKALSAKDWRSAVRSYTRAQTYHAGYKDTADKIGQAYYAWGNEQISARRYRMAAKLFGAACNSAGSGFKDAAKRGAEIFSALGAYFLKEGFCRQAVKDLKNAAKLGAGSSVQADLMKAKKCAITALAIMPFKNPTGRNLAGMAIGDTLSDAIAAQIRKNASTYIRLVDRSALNQVLAEQNLTAKGIATGRVTKIRGVRFIVVGKITQLQVQTPAVSKTVQRVRVEAPYKCQTGVTKRGRPIMGICWRPMRLAFTLHDGQALVKVAGTLRTIDTKTGDQVISLSLQEKAEDKVKWADGFMNASDQALVDIGRLRGVPRELETLSAARKTLATEEQLAEKVLKPLVAKASRAILTKVDVDRKSTDPTTLDVSVQDGS